MLSVVLLLACAPKVAPVSEVPGASGAPDAEQRAHVHTEHGVERADPYYWMRDREDPAVIAYLEAENAYTDQQTAHTAGWRESLAAEMLARIQETDVTVPYRDGSGCTTTAPKRGWRIRSTVADAARAARNR